MSETSFFRDLVCSRDDPSAQERLRRNQAEAIDNLQMRDVTTTSGLTGIVPPMYLSDLLAEYPRASRPFADAIGAQPLQEFGMTATVPRVTAGATADVQAAEANAVSETDPDTDVLSVPVITIAGQVDLSSQASDWATPFNPEGSGKRTFRLVQHAGLWFEAISRRSAIRFRP